VIRYRWAGPETVMVGLQAALAALVIRRPE
jgi:hypothetical protein